MKTSLSVVLPSSSATLFTLMVDWCRFDFVYLSIFLTLFFSYVKRITYLSWGGGPKMWRIPVLFGQGSPPHLCYRGKICTRDRTCVLVGLRHSGNSLPRKEPTRNEKDHALQALFLLRRRPCPARELLRKFRSLGLPPLLFPALQGGRIRGGVSGCTWCCVPGGFLHSRLTSVEREGRECLWTFVRCARARLCLFSPFGSWGGGGCLVAADSPCPRHFLGCFSPLITARSST